MSRNQEPYISKTFSVSKTVNGAYILEFGDLDYGRLSPGDRAAFESHTEALDWLLGRVGKCFGEVVSRQYPIAPPEPNPPCVVGNG